MQDQFLTIDEVAAYLKIPKSTIYKLSQKRNIPSCKIGKQLRFRKSSLDEWLAHQENKIKTVSSNQFPVPERTLSPSKPKYILLIDDDQLVLKTIATFLKANGYHVEPVATGKEALERVKKVNFDLVISDIRMPEMDGIETIERIRNFHNNYNKPSIPEILISGYVDARTERKAEELGITDRIHKPFLANDFIETIKRRIN